MSPKQYEKEDKQHLLDQAVTFESGVYFAYISRTYFFETPIEFGDKKHYLPYNKRRFLRRKCSSERNTSTAAANSSQYSMSSWLPSLHPCTSRASLNPFSRNDGDQNPPTVPRPVRFNTKNAAVCHIMCLCAS
jgi:hypothetical protein